MMGWNYGGGMMGATGGWGLLGPLFAVVLLVDLVLLGLWLWKQLNKK
ncbi:hypothetical protein HY411_02435 [Candidatus Gottesmanbacteria bacterium]|nr:hypothetical protein [Candidatus Gottesmanbacteria bacterium]